MVVTPGQPFATALKRTINGFRRGKHVAGRVDINNCALELLSWNLRKASRAFLERSVIDLAPGELAPSFNPQTAKMTLAVPNHERLGRRIGDAPSRFARHQRRTSNVEPAFARLRRGRRPTSNSENW